MLIKQFIKLIALGCAMMIAVTTNAQAESDHVFKFDDVAWQETGLEGAQMAILWGKEEDNSAVFAFKIQPGVEIPPHLHANDYWGIAVQGNWVHIDEHGEEVSTAQEAYTLIRGGEAHSDRCAGPEVCINVLDFVGARDIVFPE
ncbi:cupin domain-containing protein [Curvivirga sp.]|uniref:cupin domain-containing protein n=1 Tax=Curvivirga sp. TaxID=2856848 RepID=UPI003B59F1D7